MTPAFLSFITGSASRFEKQPRIRFWTILRSQGCLKLMLLLAALPGLLIHLGASPPAWYDEGLITNASLTLSRQGVYGTQTAEGLIPFDVSVTSGPPIILPVAMIFHLFGPGMFQARLVSVGYGLLALWMTFLIASRLAGTRAGLFATLGLIALPSIGGISFVGMSRQVLGETASLGLLLAGLWLWWEAMERQSRWRRLAAGGVLGLSVLAKLQSGLPIMGALGLLWMLRSWRKPAGVWRSEAEPLLAACATILGWQAMSWLGTPASVRGLESGLEWSAIQILILHGPIGRPLTRGLWMIVALMAVGLALISRDAAAAARKLGNLSAKDTLWGALFLVIALNLVWVLGLSIGWPRYAYLGLMLAAIVWAIAASRILDGVLAVGRARFVWLTRVEPWVAFALIMGVGFSSLLVSLRGPAIDPAQQMAGYINEHLPEGAVIESWEWQIDALSRIGSFHHPGQARLLAATSQYFYGHKAFDIRYPVNAGLPEHLLIGPFASWTQVYANWLGSGHYEPVAGYGPYTLFQLKTP